MKQLKAISLIIISLIVSCCSQKTKSPNILFEFENSELIVSEFNICQTEKGFEISFDESIKAQIANKIVKNVFIQNEEMKTEIKLFNILYSSKETIPHQTPTTPGGRISIFKDGERFFIDIKSKEPKEILKLLENKTVDNCASY